MTEQFNENLARRQVLELEQQIAYSICSLTAAGMKRLAARWADLNSDKTWPLSITVTEHNGAEQGPLAPSGADVVQTYINEAYKDAAECLRRASVDKRGTSK